MTGEGGVFNILVSVGSRDLVILVLRNTHTGLLGSREMNKYSYIVSRGTTGVTHAATLSRPAIAMVTHSLSAHHGNSVTKHFLFASVSSP